MVEKMIDKEMAWSDGPERFPHCEPRVLHLPEDCKYCADAPMLQEERVRLEVSNTGHTNRKFPCPAEQARSLKNSINKWHGNTPQKEGDPEPDPFGLKAYLAEHGEVDAE